MTLALFLLAYLAVGVLFLLCYLLAMRPDPKGTPLGLIAVLWPLVILLDLVLALAVQLEVLARSLAARFEKK